MYNLRFSSEELILLETILKKNISPNNTADTTVLSFNQDEMENMEKILLIELHKNVDIWFALLQNQLNQRTLIEKILNKTIKPTLEMSKQWKYTGKIEEIYDRIAAPIGKSKRASLE